MLQTSNTSSDSSSSSSSESDSDQEGTTTNNSNNRNVISAKSTPSKSTPFNNNRKRKLSAINSNSNNNHNNNHNHNNHPSNHPNPDLTLNGPPKKRQRTNNLTINAQIGPTDTTSTSTEIKNDTETTTTNNNRSRTNNTSNSTNNKRKKKKSDKSKKKKRKKASTPPKKQVDGVKIDDLNCIVCFSLPPNKIYQCVNSHLLCDSCYGRLRQGKQCVCPQCRVRMSRREPARNKLAEKYLEAHLFECENKSRGCKEKIQFKYLAEHAREECKYREVQCKYHILGCKWSGLAKDRSQHNKKCPIKSTDPKKILKLVEHLNNSNAQKQKKKELLVNKYVKMAKLFELRARNISCKDVRIQQWNSDTKTTMTLNSNVFNALHYRWQLQLKVEKVPNPKSMDNNNNNSNNGNNGDNHHHHYPELNKLKIRLMCMRSIRRRLPLEIVVVKGPDFGYTLEPIQFECELKKNVRESPWIDMIPNNILFNDEDCKDKFFTSYNSDNKMNLRVILVDKRANGPSNSFGGDNDNFNDGGFEFDAGDFLSDEDEDDESFHGGDNAHNHNSSNSGDRARRYESSPERSSSSSSSNDSSSTSSQTDYGTVYSDLDYSSSEDFY